jgi:hypothetical protein
MIECPDQRCFGNGTARDIADLKAILTKNSVQLDTSSTISDDWNNGLTAYTQGKYKEAADFFNKVVKAYPANYLAPKFVDLANSKVTNSPAPQPSQPKTSPAPKTSPSPSTTPKTSPTPTPIPTPGTDQQVTPLTKTTPDKIVASDNAKIGKQINLQVVVILIVATIAVIFLTTLILYLHLRRNHDDLSAHKPISMPPAPFQSSMPTMTVAPQTAPLTPAAPVGAVPTAIHIESPPLAAAPVAVPVVQPLPVAPDTAVKPTAESTKYPWK